MEKEKNKLTKTKTIKKTQTSEILKYLQSHKRGITSTQAFEMFGATRLSAIIYSLRNNGYNINAVNEKGVNRYGGVCNYARYVLDK